ncbi:hypothetical protein SEA_GIANTSBANE_75 [Arthrobacter phage Giantsbane]|nr:hypothetical protein SEA_GIANTSBANE_75 [Arthrobacter phage Giantsbane]
MVYFTVECGDPKPHKAHSWREGFLWHRKRECGGCPEKSDWLSDIVVAYSEADVAMTTALYERLYHRHKFVLNGDTNSAYLVWHCEKEFCDTKFVQARYHYVTQTINGHQFAFQPWEL